MVRDLHKYDFNLVINETPNHWRLVLFEKRTSCSERLMFLTGSVFFPGPSCVFYPRCPAQLYSHEKWTLRCLFNGRHPCVCVCSDEYLAFRRCSQNLMMSQLWHWGFTSSGGWCPAFRRIVVPSAWRVTLSKGLGCVWSGWVSFWRGCAQPAILQQAYQLGLCQPAFLLSFSIQQNCWLVGNCDCAQIYICVCMVLPVCSWLGL